MDHEYAVVGGYNRADVGKWLARISAVISAIAVFILLSAVDLAHRLGINVNVPPAFLSLIGAGVIYAGLYWILNNHAWKLPALKRILKIPNLSGEWHCDGLSLDKCPPVKWSGKVTIVQSWDKLRVHLKTHQSESDSVSAALIHDSAVGYRLMYHYRNQPRIGEIELSHHHGFAEIVFPSNSDEVIGEYFNGRGRNTYGSMKLSRGN